MSQIGERISGSERFGNPEQTGFFGSKQCAIPVGIVGPIVCFGLRPIVLDAWVVREVLGLRLISVYWVFCYAFTGLEIATLALWLWRGHQLGKLAGATTGILFGGAVYAIVTWLILLPASVLGIAVNGIGLLGFIPLFTALTFLAHARRAHRRARAVLGFARTAAAAAIGAALVFGIPAALQIGFVQLGSQAIEDVAREGITAATGARRWSLETNPDEIISAYEIEMDAKRRMQLALAYKEVSGLNIETRLEQLRD
jgi:hypothetical protein